MPVRRKKALTKAQIAALAAYEPHLSAASRAACLEATKPNITREDIVEEYHKGFYGDGLRLNWEKVSIDLSPYLIGKSEPKSIKGIIHAPITGENYVAKEPTWTFAIWCPYRNRYISDCIIFADIELGEYTKTMYLKKAVTLTTVEAMDSVQAYLHLNCDGKTMWFKPLGFLDPTTKLVIQEGPLCDFLPV